jgi:competence CoiA-like predicted nuclease
LGTVWRIALVRKGADYLLVANTKGGERINLFEKHNLLTLKEFRKQNVFFCPECSEEVVLKIGSKRIPHFSHKKGSECPESYERESEYHINGKLLLYSWLKEKGLDPVLEPYYSDISQRPDIGVNYEGEDYAIEYQCSVISEALFIKRSEAYIQSGIIPIWILAGKNLRRIGKNKISLSGFQYLFLHKTALDNWVIPFFCPITKSFINTHQIVPFTVRNSFSNFDIIPLSHASLKILFDPPHLPGNLSHYEWQREIRQTKNFLSQTRGSFHNKFLQELYSHSLIPSLLPPEIGLPVFHAPYIETSPLQWQGYLFMDVLLKDDVFSFEKMISCFHKRVWKSDIKIRKLPLVHSGEAVYAVKEYIELLVNLKVLERAGKGLYRKRAPFSASENQTSLLQWEEDFYREKGTIIVDGTKQSIFVK